MLYFYEFPVQFHFTCRYTRGGRQLARFSSSRGPQDAHSLSGDTSGLLRSRNAPGRDSRPREKPRTARAQRRPLQGCVYNLGGEGSQMVAPHSFSHFLPHPRAPPPTRQGHSTPRHPQDGRRPSGNVPGHTHETDSRAESPRPSSGFKPWPTGNGEWRERLEGADARRCSSRTTREGRRGARYTEKHGASLRPATHGPPPSPSAVPPQRPPAVPAHLPLRLVGRGGRWNGEPGSHSPASRGIERQRRAAGGRHPPAASLRSGVEATLRSPTAGGKGCSAISKQQRGSRAGGRGRLSRSAPRPGAPEPGARARAREGRAASAEGPALLPALLPDSATAPRLPSEPAPGLS